MLLLNHKKTKKNSAGCAMTFCKEMSSRVEEPFCKNICFLGIDSKYCSDLYMFLIRLNHLIAALGSNVRHSSSFRAAMAAIFGFGGGTNFLLGVVLAEDGQGSFASCKCDDVHGYLMCFFVHVLSCSFFWYSCDNTNARHHERSSGRQ